MTLAKTLGVFVAVVALDVAYALYVVETTARNVMLASAWAAAIQLFNFVIVLSFVKDWRMVWPAVAGAFVGTWGALEFVG